jgi:hypothetical protein
VPLPGHILWAPRLLAPKLCGMNKLCLPATTTCTSVKCLLCAGVTSPLIICFKMRTFICINKDKHLVYARHWANPFGGLQGKVCVLTAACLPLIWGL